MHQSGDAGVQRARAHRDRDEGADREHEEEHLHGADQAPDPYGPICAFGPSTTALSTTICSVTWILRNILFLGHDRLAGLQQFGRGGFSALSLAPFSSSDGCDGCRP